MYTVIKAQAEMELAVDSALAVGVSILLTQSTQQGKFHIMNPLDLSTFWYRGHINKNHTLNSLTF